MKEDHKSTSAMFRYDRLILGVSVFVLGFALFALHQRRRSGLSNEELERLTAMFKL
jgi:hypothetical protein